MLFSGSWGKMIHEKNLKQKKYRDTVPSNLNFLSNAGRKEWPRLMGLLPMGVRPMSFQGQTRKAAAGHPLSVTLNG
jgi:hypothetical protein